MKYRVTIEGVEKEVDVQISPGGVILASIEGEPLKGDVTSIPGGVSLTIQGKVYDVLVGGAPEKMDVAAGYHRVTSTVESERVLAKKSKKGGSAQAGKELVAPMPGRVVKILVSVGDKVDANQPLVVIEAMKMENELRSSSAVEIASIDVTEGQTVESNSILMRFA